MGSLDGLFPGALIGIVVGALSTGLLLAALGGPSPCKHSVHAFSYFASCGHPDHHATLTSEYGPLLLVCECPAEVTP